MKITFQTAEAEQSVKQQTQVRTTDAAKKADSVYGAVLLPGENRLLGSGEKKSWAEFRQEAQVKDVSVQQDYRTLLSHTMSQEDYARLEEEGFHFESLDPEEAVTILDKIKAQLARSGQNIIGYTDDIDMDTLAAALGSDTLARAVSHSFREADLPLTAENIEGVKEAWNMASNLTDLDAGTRSYLVENAMEPEIWNVYLAQSSGAKGKESSLQQGPKRIGPKYYAEEIKGYYAQSAQTPHMEELQAQADKVIEKAGFSVNEHSREMAGWLLDRSLPLTAENLQRVQMLETVPVPVTEEAFAAAAAEAVSGGKEPVFGNLGRSEDIYHRAAEVLSYYENLSPKQLGDSVTARRQLEEIRLRMTAEVNVKLLKSGFSIDTAPMEELVEALREAEAKLAGTYFPGEEEPLTKYRLYRDTNEVIAQLPAMPARILGPLSIQESQTSLTEIYEQGKAAKAVYEKAGESYEALMTSPRGDMGDSIQKAFANVDELLSELSYELTDENRRAVRILGYNRMEITGKNIELVKAADEQVQSVIEKMKPAAVLQMIRDGINPLEKTLPELEEYFSGLPEDFEETAESYSRFLYGLEKNKAVTEDERETYIGIYRLLRQIEKSDGAVVGALVNSQAQLHLKNLLSAVRSGKFRHLDVKAQDRLEQVIQKGESISEQIARAFAGDVRDIVTEVSQETDNAQEYRRQKLEQLRSFAVTENECVALLQKGQTTPSVHNLLAAQALLQNRELFYSARRKWTGNGEEMAEMKSLADGLWETLEDKDEFSGEYQKLVKETGKEVEEALQEAASSVDVRELRLAHRQLALAEKLARQEEYFFSMYVGEELTGIRLTVERNGPEKGKVSVTCRFSEEETLHADFWLANEKITAYVAGNEKTEVTKLQKIADTFTEEASGHWIIEKVSVVQDAGRGPDMTEEQEISGEGVSADNGQLYRIAKTFLEAVRQQERGSV